MKPPVFNTRDQIIEALPLNDVVQYNLSVWGGMLVRDPHDVADGERARDGGDSGGGQGVSNIVAVMLGTHFAVVEKELDSEGTRLENFGDEEREGG